MSQQSLITSQLLHIYQAWKLAYFSFLKTKQISKLFVSLNKNLIQLSQILHVKLSQFLKMFLLAYLIIEAKQNSTQI